MVDVRIDRGTAPLVHGVARLASLAFAGGSLTDLLSLIGPSPATVTDRAAWLMDRSWAHALSFRPDAAASLQREALAITGVFRLRGAATGPRLLALCAPGDLGANAPLEFLTEPGDVRLSLAFLTADGALPSTLPDHDVAIVAATNGAPAVLAALARSFSRWPRPVLNDPARILSMSRGWLPPRLAGLPGVTTPPAQDVARAALAAAGPEAMLPGSSYPYLIRPAGSHGGQGLVRIDGPEQLHPALAACTTGQVTLSSFVDTCGEEGWYRKYRVVLVGGEAYVAHMAAGDHWMVHYLSAGMEFDGRKRAAEAEAMDGRFVRRHHAALGGIARAIGLDYVSIDCTQARDGRLLVFEADAAAIVHSMDSPERYPYKRPAMQRCYDAFGHLVRSRCETVRPGATEPALRRVGCAA